MSTRQTKTPQQRAQEALDVATRHAARLRRKKTALEADLAAIAKEHESAVVRREYLAKHPDLAEQNTTTTTGAPTA